LFFGHLHDLRTVDLGGSQKLRGYADKKSHDTRADIFGGDPAILKLPSKQTAGYRYSVSESFPLLKINELPPEPDKESGTGRASVQGVPIPTLRAGGVILGLKYLRPLVKDKPQAKSFRCILVIEAAR